MSWKNVPINHKLGGPAAFLSAAIQSISSLPPVHLGARQARHVLWHHINTARAGGPIKRSIKLTLSPAACFSAYAARWGRRAAGSGTRSRPWWGTQSRRCSRNPAPGGPLHLGEAGKRVLWLQSKTTRRFLIRRALVRPWGFIHGKDEMPVTGFPLSVLLSLDQMILSPYFLEVKD